VRIAQLAANVESVPPTGYGGTEVVINILTEALAEKHDVTLFATGDSKTRAKLVSVTETALRTNTQYLQRQWQSFDIQTLLRLKGMQDDFDIVHNHMGYQALPVLSELKIPAITTLHNPIKPYNYPVFTAFKHLPYVAISNAYKMLNCNDVLNYVGTVYNGIDLNLYPFTEKNKRDYLLFLGRVCHDKGTTEAIDIAESLGLPLKIAGKVDEPDKAYFEERIRPRLSNSVEFVGEVNHNQKVELYGNAIALVHAINFNEPFGLTLIESMACGTPVLAIKRGSIPEIVEDGKTGIIGHDKSELIKRFAQIQTIKPTICRQRVQERFSKEAMVDGYEKIYWSFCHASPQTRIRQDRQNLC
jgi:glycosyltransferase involved in cell wall biosynthesis